MQKMKFLWVSPQISGLLPKSRILRDEPKRKRKPLDPDSPDPHSFMLYCSWETSIALSLRPPRFVLKHHQDSFIEIPLTIMQAPKLSEALANPLIHNTHGKVTVWVAEALGLRHLILEMTPAP